VLAWMPCAEIGPPDVGIGNNFVCVSLFENSSRFHNICSVDETERITNIVIRNQDADAVLCQQCYRSPHIGDSQRIKSGKRLV